MRGASKVRKIAFVGDHLPRKCNIASATDRLPWPARLPKASASPWIAPLRGDPLSVFDRARFEPFTDQANEPLTGSRPGAGPPPGSDPWVGGSLTCIGTEL